MSEDMSPKAETNVTFSEECASELEVLILKDPVYQNVARLRHWTGITVRNQVCKKTGSTKLVIAAIRDSEPDEILSKIDSEHLPTLGNVSRILKGEIATRLYQPDRLMNLRNLSTSFSPVFQISLSQKAINVYRDCELIENTQIGKIDPLYLFELSGEDTRNCDAHTVIVPKPAYWAVTQTEIATGENIDLLATELEEIQKALKEGIDYGRIKAWATVEQENGEFWELLLLVQDAPESRQSSADTNRIRLNAASSFQARLVADEDLRGRQNIELTTAVPNNGYINPMNLTIDIDEDGHWNNILYDQEQVLQKIRQASDCCSKVIIRVAATNNGHAKVSLYVPAGEIITGSSIADSDDSSVATTVTTAFEDSKRQEEMFVRDDVINAIRADLQSTLYTLQVTAADPEQAESAAGETSLLKITLSESETREFESGMFNSSTWNTIQQWLRQHATRDNRLAGDITVDVSQAGAEYAVELKLWCDVELDKEIHKADEQSFENSTVVCNCIREMIPQKLANRVIIAEPGKQLPEQQLFITNFPLHLNEDDIGVLLGDNPRFKQSDAGLILSCIDGFYRMLESNESLIVIPHVDHGYEFCTITLELYRCIQ